MKKPEAQKQDAETTRKKLEIELAELNLSMARARKALEEVQNELDVRRAEVYARMARL